MWNLIIIMGIILGALFLMALPTIISESKSKS